MIRTPTRAELEALDEELGGLAGPERDNHEFFAFYNAETGLASKITARGERRPLSMRESIERWIRIRDVDGDIVALAANTAQRTLECAVILQERAGVPVRQIILKARKVGMSTWIEARGFMKTITLKHQKVLVVAHNDDTSTEVLKMAHLMRDEIPKSDGTRWRFAFGHAATYHLALKAPMHGEMMIASAQHSGGSAPGRGFTPSFLHMSEMAFYSDAKKTCQALLNSMPKRAKTAVFIESTANGDTGDFKDRFWKAWADRDVPIPQRRQSWNAIFVPWFAFEQYRWTRTVGVGRRLPDDIVLEIQKTLTDHERWLLTQKWFRRGTPRDKWEEVKCQLEDGSFGRKWRLRDVGWRFVDYDQLAWRRLQLRDEFNADPLRAETWTSFQEEFPSTAAEAFRTSGSLVFDPSAIYERMEECAAPQFKGEIVDTSPPKMQYKPEALIARTSLGDEKDILLDVGVNAISGR